MPDEKALELCTRIANETDPVKRNLLLADLVTFLTEEQEAIKAKIKANLMDYRGKLPW